MDIYCSTGGFKKLKYSETVDMMLNSEIDKIELSGGIPDAEFNIEELLSIRAKAKIMLHNYFPPAEQPFVLNLASLDREILNRTIEFFRNSIDFSSKIGAKYYGIHSGFLVDPKIQELGATISANKIAPRAHALEIFVHEVAKLAKYAADRQVSLLVENNVISKENFQKNKADIMLLAHPEEVDVFFQGLSESVGLLLDVGHLKVSCSTLGVDLLSSLKTLNKWAKGYHLSENSGLFDDHLIFNESAWFIPHLKRDIAFCTLEIENSSTHDIRALVSILEGVMA